MAYGARLKGRPPAKGTKRREALLLIMRNKGANWRELCDVLGKSKHKPVRPFLRAMIDEKGYDIRLFPNGYYKLVGKVLSGGRYRSFVSVD